MTVQHSSDARFSSLGEDDGGGGSGSGGGGVDDDDDEVERRREGEIVCSLETTTKLSVKLRTSPRSPIRNAHGTHWPTSFVGEETGPESRGRRLRDRLQGVRRGQERVLRQPDREGGCGIGRESGGDQSRVVLGPGDNRWPPTGVSP